VAVDYERTLMLLSDCSFDLLILDDHSSGRNAIQVVEICSAPASCRRSSSLHVTAGSQSCLRKLGCEVYPQASS
jgi:hypothetical protein